MFISDVSFPKRAAALLETYGDKPVHESAWRRNVIAVKQFTKERLTPYIYKAHMSRQERETLVENAKKLQKSVRKEKEKLNEARKKNIDRKLSVSSIESAKNASQVENMETAKLTRDDEENDIFKTYKPKGLVTSKYPKKNEMVKRP